MQIWRLDPPMNFGNTEDRTIWERTPVIPNNSEGHMYNSKITCLDHFVLSLPHKTRLGKGFADHHIRR